MNSLTDSDKIPSKKYSHPIGTGILNSIENMPLSASEIALKVDFPREKIYYHLKKLLSQNLIYVAETDVINGITKKSFLKVTASTVSEIDISKSNDSNTDEIFQETYPDGPVDDSSINQEDQLSDDLIIEKDSKDVLVADSSVEPQDDSSSNDDIEIKTESKESLMEVAIPRNTGTSILDKLLSNSAQPRKKIDKPDVPVYEETATDDELTHSINVQGVVYLIPEADYSIGGIDYIVRSARREDGKDVTIQDKITLGDHLEHLRIASGSQDDQPAIDFTTEDISDHIAVDEFTKNKHSSGWGLYLSRRLSGYYNAVTFAQQDNKVRYMRASINRKGFKILDQEIYNLPLQDDGQTVTDLPSLIQYVYRTKIKKKHWSSLYLAYYSNQYSIDIDPLKAPDIKGKELEGFVTVDICKRFSVDAENAIVNWIEYKTKAEDPQKQFIVALGDRIPIEKDYKTLVAQKIQPRFTTPIAKIQFDLYRYNYPDDKGNVILVYIGLHRTFITIVNDWMIKDSRSSVVSTGNFLEGRSFPLTQGKDSLSTDLPHDGSDTQSMDIAGVLRSLDVRNEKRARAIFEKLESEIYATIKFFKAQGFYLSNQILIGGVGANIPKIQEYISEDFDKNVSILLSPDTVQYAGEVPILDGEDFSINIGLLLDPKDRLNLLPKTQRDNNRFIYPLNLGKIAGLVLIILGTFFTLSNYFKAIELDSDLKDRQVEIADLTRQNDLFYDITYKLAITDLIHGTEAYDQYISTKIIQVLKFLTSSLPETILFDQLIFSKANDEKPPTLTMVGRISTPGAESNIVLNNMMFYLRDSNLLENVSLREQGTGENGTLNFTVDFSI